MPDVPGLDALLAAIKERAKTATAFDADLLAGFSAVSVGGVIAASAVDVPLLVAALEAVLKLTDSATVLLSACGVSGRCSCGEHPVAWDLDPAKIRAAITNELNGERGGHARTA